MLESIMPEVAYKCDRCGELFNSPVEARNHSLDTHPESGLIDDSDRGL